jgi:folate-binding protein YgfZ
MTSSVHDGPSLHGSALAGVYGEFRALLDHSGVYHLADRAKIVLTGGDRTRWLNGMVTNNIRDLAVGHGVYAFLLNPQGHILGDLHAYNRGESILIETDSSQRAKLLSTFDHYIIMDDVEVSDQSEQWSTVGITGPESRETLVSAGFAFPTLEPLEFADIQWHGESVTVLRTDNPALEGYEVWLSAGTIDLLLQSLTKLGSQLVGPDALELLRVSSGIPQYGRDIRERDLPQETEQQRALHFSKGCYVGQEIVERIRSRGAVHRKFTGFYVEGELPDAGAKVQTDGADGKEVGEITSVATVPAAYATRQIALGYVRREFATPGKQLVAGSSHLSFAALPFAEIFGHPQAINS